MKIRGTRWLAAAMIAVGLTTSQASAGPGPGAQAAEARLVSLGYSMAEAQTKLAGLTEEEMALVAEDPSLIQVGGIDTGQAVMLVLATTLFLTLIFIVFA